MNQFGAAPAPKHESTFPTWQAFAELRDTFAILDREMTAERCAQHPGMAATAAKAVFADLVVLIGHLDTNWKVRDQLDKNARAKEHDELRANLKRYVKASETLRMLRFGQLDLLAWGGTLMTATQARDKIRREALESWEALKAEAAKP